MNTFSRHRPSYKKKSTNRFWIFHYFLGSINKDIITTLEISKPINNKKPKNSQKLIKNLRDPQSKVDIRQGIDQNYYQKRNSPKQSLNFFKKKYLLATIQPMASDTIAFYLQSQIP